MQTPLKRQQKERKIKEKISSWNWTQNIDLQCIFERQSKKRRHRVTKSMPFFHEIILGWISERSLFSNLISTVASVYIFFASFLFFCFCLHITYHDWDVRILEPFLPCRYNWKAARCRRYNMRNDATVMIPNGYTCWQKRKKRNKEIKLGFHIMEPNERNNLGFFCSKYDCCCCVSCSPIFVVVVVVLSSCRHYIQVYATKQRTMDFYKSTQRVWYFNI